MTYSATHAGLEYILAGILQDFMQFMHRTGLSALQIHTLMHIYHAGECPLADIARLTDSSKPAASQLVDRLVQQGLLERSEDPHDRRNKLLRLTGKSHELIKNGVTSNQFLTDLMNSLPQDQRESVQTVLGHLAQAGQQTHPSHTHKDGKNA